MPHQQLLWPSQPNGREVVKGYMITNSHSPLLSFEVWLSPVDCYSSPDAVTYEDVDTASPIMQKQNKT